VTLEAVLGGSGGVVAEGRDQSWRFRVENGLQGCCGLSILIGAD
jgi:hypothetical protein